MNRDKSNLDLDNFATVDEPRRAAENREIPYNSRLMAIRCSITSTAIATRKDNLMKHAVLLFSPVGERHYSHSSLNSFFFTLSIIRPSHIGHSSNCSGILNTALPNCRDLFINSVWMYILLSVFNSF